jgi:hypothetical protein
VKLSRSWWHGQVLVKQADGYQRDRLALTLVVTAIVEGGYDGHIGSLAHIGENCSMTEVLDCGMKRRLTLQKGLYNVM